MRNDKTDWRPPDGRKLARERCLTLIRNIMTRFPDMRIGQVVVNALPTRFNCDPFNCTDEELAEGLQHFWEKATS